MPEINPDVLREACPGVPAALLAPTAAALSASLPPAGIDSDLRAAMYLAQVCHETVGLTHFEENLNYSVDAIRRVWPGRFPSIELATPFAHAPERLGNRTYADRMGNGDEESGDGWKYRGRGGAMITGYDAYLASGTFLGLDLRNQPERAAQLDAAFLTSAWFWRTRGMSAFADASDLHRCTIRWNGGLTGIDSRARWYGVWRQALGLAPAPLAA